MKKQKIQMILRMLICIVISFVFIYLMVFFGGWKLIESGNPIFIEIAVSIIVGILLDIIVELSKHFEAKFDNMTAQIQELETRVEKLSEK